jgi:hypothetical protein
MVEKNFSPDTQFKLGGVIDAIAGATPSGEPAPAPGGQVPLTEMHDRRKAWNSDLSHQFSRINIDLGYANSRESDYLSNGLSVNTLTDFNAKNTTLLVGVAGSNDQVKVFYQTPPAQKHDRTAIIGVTQLLNPQTSVTLNLTCGRTLGYLNDPYRVVEKTLVIPFLPPILLPESWAENRPDRRGKWVAFLGLNHAFPAVNGAIDASYRFYHDTFGIHAHTLELAWLQKLFGDHIVLNPGFRFYTQSAADFYYLTLDGTSITPSGTPDPGGNFYSADYRLAQLRTLTYDLKIVWRVTDWLAIDGALGYYSMRGRDGITPQSAFPSAKVITFGSKITW